LNQFYPCFFPTDRPLHLRSDSFTRKDCESFNVRNEKCLRRQIHLTWLKHYIKTLPHSSNMYNFYVPVKINLIFKRIFNQFHPFYLCGKAHKELVPSLIDRQFTDSLMASARSQDRSSTVCLPEFVSKRPYSSFKYVCVCVCVSVCACLCVCVCWRSNSGPFTCSTMSYTSQPSNTILWSNSQ
jgi:hypothetical protein